MDSKINKGIEYEKIYNNLLLVERASFVSFYVNLSVAKKVGLPYKEFFIYGCRPNGGFALGIDILTMLLLGLPSLKETMFLFRGPNRITP